MRRIVALGLLLALAGVAPDAFAQGCVMCRQTAAAGGEEAAKALDLGILVLLIPTISIFVGVVVYAFRRRNHTWPEPTDADADSSLPFPADRDVPSDWRSLRQ